MLVYAASCPPPNLNSAELFSLQTILTENLELVLPTSDSTSHKHTLKMAHEYKYDVSMSCSGEYEKRRMVLQIMTTDQRCVDRDTAHELL